MTFTPIWPSASAAPDSDEAALLPCLATGTPQAATVKMVAVEMFRVFLPEPPVPTISIAPSGAFTGTQLRRMAEAAPAISSTVSPRVRRAISSPPIWLGVASPENRMSKACSASSPVRARSAAAPMRGFRASLMPSPLLLPDQGSFEAACARVPRRSIQGGTVRRGSAVPCGANP